jgi:hypothetical protein
MQRQGGAGRRRRRPGRLRVAGATIALVAVAGLLTAVAAVAGAGAVPENTTVPQISGALVEGELLTATQGTWTEDPTSFAYQWQRCDPGNAGSCADIGGATSPLYVLGSDDVTKAVRVQVVASNPNGPSTPANSALTGAVTAAEAPSNDDPPSIGGSVPPEVDDELTANPGTWDGEPAPDLTYQWLRCNGPAPANCAPIPGATSQKYTPVQADLGLTLRVEVTAQNASGIAAVTTDDTAAVAASTRPVNTAR